MTAHAEAPNYEKGKFTELLLYVASRMLGDPSYGSVKLNKVLFFSDVIHYAQFGTSITGAEYVRQRLGPAPRGITDVQAELQMKGDADLAVLQRGTRVQKILFPKRAPTLDVFKGSEIATVEAVIEAFRDHTAEEVSDLSHTLDGWKFAREHEVIPYWTIFLYNGLMTDEDVTRGLTLANELREQVEQRVGTGSQAA